MSSTDIALVTTGLIALLVITVRVIRGRNPRRSPRHPYNRPVQRL